MVSHQLYLSEYLNMWAKMTMLLKEFLLDPLLKASHSGHQGQQNRFDQREMLGDL
uniref:Uncharacterized protein n=1 Tax=Arundo donax TaxID=35708 RepID=A0A0A9E1I0_ARUDO